MGIAVAALAVVILYASYLGSRLDESVAANLRRYRTFWRRFFAGAVDGLIYMAVSVGVWIYLGAPETGVIHPFADLLVLFVLHGYEIILHWECGKTVGKMVTGVTVVSNPEETPLTFRQAVLRDIVPLSLAMALWGMELFTWFEGEASLPVVAVAVFLRWFPLAWYVAEFITMLTNPKRRAIHDIIAGTVVVRDAEEKPQKGSARSDGYKPG